MRDYQIVAQCCTIQVLEYEKEIIMADLFWNWIDPSYSQFFLVNIGWIVVLFLYMFLSTFLVGVLHQSLKKTAIVLGCILFIVFFAIYFYPIIINIRSIYLMVSAGVHGFSQWVLLLLYVFMVLQSPLFQRFRTEEIKNNTKNA